MPDDYILRSDAKNAITDQWWTEIDRVPAADVVEEENILKFYYVRSIDEYWLGRRVDNFYYAEYDSKTRQWVWTHSRYLPWGEHIISTTSLWKEHTYPSKPEEIPFAEWLQGFIRKHIAADMEPKRKTGVWLEEEATDDGNWRYICSVCGYTDIQSRSAQVPYCWHCGSIMQKMKVEK